MLNKCDWKYSFIFDDGQTIRYDGISHVKDLRTSETERNGSSNFSSSRADQTENPFKISWN